MAAEAARAPPYLAAGGMYVDPPSPTQRIATARSKSSTLLVPDPMTMPPSLRPPMITPEVEWVWDPPERVLSSSTPFAPSDAALRRNDSSTLESLARNRCALSTATSLYIGGALVANTRTSSSGSAGAAGSPSRVVDIRTE